MTPPPLHAAGPRHVIATWLKPLVTTSELLLAGKAALAVGISWFLAPHLPGVADDYPYYAPLGALVSMYPTLMGSVKNGLQTLAGLAIGVLLAAAVIVLSEPNLVTISLVVGIGFLISGSHQIKTAREFVPITALFVLIVGGPNADSYSIGYLVQVCLGLTVGLAVNLLILPSLSFTHAEAQLSRFRVTLAEHLSDIATALTEHWPPETDEWAAQNDALTRTAREVRAAVQLADESRKGNPRARIHHRDLAADFDNVVALETVGFHVRNLTELLAGAVWGDPVPAEIPPEVRPKLSVAIQSISDVLSRWDAGDTRVTDRTDAEDALRDLMKTLDDRRDLGAESLTPAAAIVMDLRRILVALEPRVVRDMERIREATSEKSE